MAMVLISIAILFVNDKAHSHHGRTVDSGRFSTCMFHYTEPVAINRTPKQYRIYKLLCINFMYKHFEKDLYVDKAITRTWLQAMLSVYPLNNIF